MRVTYKSILERIVDVIQESDESDLVIDTIYLNSREWDRALAELARGPYHLMPIYGAKTFRFFGIKIRKEDE